MAKGRGGGRKSAETRATRERVLAMMGLPPPPPYLPQAEQGEWREIVEAYPPDRFPRATWPMLESYCRHAVQARLIGKMIDKFLETPFEADPAMVRAYDRLLTMLTNQTKTVATFGVRLGIARTSMAGRHNNDPDQTRGSATDSDPWDRTKQQ